MSTVFVLTCNDAVTCVVKGTQDQATSKLEKVKEAYFFNNRWTFGNTEREQRQVFQVRCHWATRETPFLDFTS